MKEETEKGEGLGEQPFFFDVGSERLFAVMHSPAAGAARHGVILCHALGEEKLWSHRVFVSLARELAARGTAVLRFDFRGEGDSDLEFEEAGVASRVEDALRAAEVLLEREPGLPGVILLGHRLGGAIAAAAAGRMRARALGLIVWDPLPTGREYLMSLLRANVAAQLALESRVTRTRQKLVQALEAGGTVLIDGYRLGQPLFRELVALDWPGMLAGVPLPTLLVEPEEPPFWHESKRLALSAPEMTKASVQWLERQTA